jgi:putative ABC transport system substrate-binding protein
MQANGRLRWAVQCMKRREFIAGLGGAAAWPLVARAQQPKRRAGILLPATPDEAEFQVWIAEFRHALSNLDVDTRWATSNAADIRRHATEIAALAPDVVLAHGAATLAPLLQVTRTVPIVFVGVTDPVGADFIESMARPGGNATGFMVNENSLLWNYLEGLKEIAPGIARVAILRDPSQGALTSNFAVIQARAFRVEITPVNMRDADEIEHAIAAFAGIPNGGLIVPGGARTLLHRELIISLAAQHRLPAVYSNSSFVAAGGLISHGTDFVDQYRRAAVYADRIFKGEKPADLPVQEPTKYELVINLKTAKALGLDVPHLLLARADEVIE